MKSFRKWWLAALLILCAAVSIVFTLYNDSFYHQTIATVTENTVTKTEAVTDQFNNKDTLYTQQLTAKITNGEKKGDVITLTNQYSDSKGFDNEYEIGHDLFIEKNKLAEKNDVHSYDIVGIKRDVHIVTLLWVFIAVLIAVGRLQGLFSVISLFINAAIVWTIISIYTTYDAYLLILCIVGIFLFTILSLLLVNGFNEKTMTAILSTLVGTFVSLGLAYIVLKLTNEQGMRYEELQFITRPYKTVFMAGLFIGSLGAVMDIAITMSSSLYGLYEKNPAISLKRLAQSGREIGKDIMGTMTNILFFAYVSGSIPMLLLYFKNQSAFGYTLSINLSLELVRALVGGIGIVLAIPISLVIVLFFIKRKQAIR